MKRGYSQQRRASKRSIHTSWRLAFACWGVLIGTLVAGFGFVLPGAMYWILPVILILATFVLGGQTAIFTVIALVAGAGIGIWRGGTVQVALQGYESFIGRSVALTGTVSEDISHGPKGDTRAQLTHVNINGKNLPGKVWVSITSDVSEPVRRGDQLRLTGKLSDGFGNLPATMPRATLVTFAPTSQQDYALRFRDWFATGIRHAIPEPAASLGSGFLLGQHSDLPGNLEGELRTVGLTHAVVASGSNLTILVGFTRRLFKRTSKYTATVLGASMTLGFILLTGFSPSMTRAGLVTGLSLLAWYYGRRIHPFVLLPLAAGITLLYDPSYIRGDIGWYLSFSAFAGVLVLAPLIQHYFWGPDFKPNLMLEILIGTTAAQLATLPVILYAFGTLSPYALPANMLVLPFIPLAMALTFVAGIAGLALPGPVAGIIGTPAGLIMDYMLRVIHWVAALPSAQMAASTGPPVLAGLCTALVLCCLYMQRRTRHRFNQGTGLLIGDRP